MKKFIDELLELNYILDDEKMQFIIDGWVPFDKITDLTLDLRKRVGSNAHVWAEIYRSRYCHQGIYMKVKTSDYSLAKRVRIDINCIGRYEDIVNNDYIKEYFDRVEELSIKYNFKIEKKITKDDVSISISKNNQINESVKKAPKDVKYFIRDLLKLNYMLDDDNIVFNIEGININRPEIQTWNERIWGKNAECSYPIYNSVIGQNLYNNFDQRVIHKKNLDLGFNKIKITFPPHDISYYTGDYHKRNLKPKKDTDDIYWIKEEYYERVKCLCVEYGLTIDSKHPYKSDLSGRDTSEISSLLTITNPNYKKPTSTDSIKVLERKKQTLSTESFYQEIIDLSFILEDDNVQITISGGYQEYYIYDSLRKDYKSNTDKVPENIKIHIRGPLTNNAKEYYDRVKSVCNRYNLNCHKNRYVFHPRNDGSGGYYRIPSNNDVNIYISKRHETTPHITKWERYIKENLTTNRDKINRFLNELVDINWVLQDANIGYSIYGVRDSSLNGIGSGTKILFVSSDHTIDEFEKDISTDKDDFRAINISFNRKDIWDDKKLNFRKHDGYGIPMREEAIEYLDRFEEICKKYGYNFYRLSYFSYFAEMRKTAYKFPKKNSK